MLLMYLLILMLSPPSSSRFHPLDSSKWSECQLESDLMTPQDLVRLRVSWIWYKLDYKLVGSFWTLFTNPLIRKSTQIRYEWVVWRLLFLRECFCGHRNPVWTVSLGPLVGSGMSAYHVWQWEQAMYREELYFTDEVRGEDGGDCWHGFGGCWIDSHSDKSGFSDILGRVYKTLIILQMFNRRSTTKKRSWLFEVILGKIGSLMASFIIIWMFVRVIAAL